MLRRSLFSGVVSFPRRVVPASGPANAAARGSRLRCYVSKSIDEDSLGGEGRDLGITYQLLAAPEGYVLYLYRRLVHIVIKTSGLLNPSSRCLCVGSRQCYQFKPIRGVRTSAVLIGVV